MALVYGISEATKDFLKKLPNQIQRLDEINEVHRELKQEFDAIEDKGIGNKFSRWQKNRVIKKIENNIDNVEHAGAKGEITAIEKRL